MPVSIKDIARQANVSYSTVSRALNDSPRISDETKERIRRIATELGYTPSAVARSLVMQRTHTIGLVVTTITDLWFAEMIHGVADAALDQGYRLILAESSGRESHERASVRALRERRVDGIILVSPLCAKELVNEKDSATPLITINNEREEPSGYWVETDNVGGGREATQHLVELGHRRVAYIGGPPGEWHTIQRQKGYEQALQAGGISVEPTLITYANSNPDGGVDAMQRLLTLPQPPTAVFCYNDATAIGAMRAAHAAGLRIPQDLSVVGFDDIDLAPFFEPPLTTISQPKLEMANRAVEMIQALIDGEDIQNSVLPNRLIVRDSTAKGPLP